MIGIKRFPNLGNYLTLSALYVRYNSLRFPQVTMVGQPYKSEISFYLPHLLSPSPSLAVGFCITAQPLVAMLHS